MYVVNDEEFIIYENQEGLQICRVKTGDVVTAWYGSIEDGNATVVVEEASDESGKKVKSLDSSQEELVDKVIDQYFLSDIIIKPKIEKPSNFIFASGVKDAPKHLEGRRYAAIDDELIDRELLIDQEREPTQEEFKRVFEQRPKFLEETKRCTTDEKEVPCLNVVYRKYLTREKIQEVLNESILKDFSLERTVSDLDKLVDDLHNEDSSWGLVFKKYIYRNKLEWRAIPTKAFWDSWNKNKEFVRNLNFRLVTRVWDTKDKGGSPCFVIRTFKNVNEYSFLVK